MAAQDHSKIDHWLDQLAMEIVLSEPDSDRSQFPIRDLLANLRDKSEGSDSLLYFHACAAFTTNFVEEIMFSNRPFNAEHLAQLNELCVEMKELRRDPKRTFKRADKLDHWIDQLKKEVASSEPGSDRSQFPIRDLVSNLRDKSAGEPKLAHFHACAGYTTDVVEDIMFSNRPFSAEHLAQLSALCSQMRELKADPKLVFKKAEKIDHWIAQLSQEISSSEPGSDRSQFPIRDLVANLRDKSTDAASLAQFHACAAFTTEYVEEIMFSGQPFSTEHLSLLNDLSAQLKQLRDNSTLEFQKPASTQSAPDTVCLPLDDEMEEEVMPLTPVAPVIPVSPAQAAKPIAAPAAAPVPAPAPVPSKVEEEEYVLINLVNDGDLLREFATESREHLENIEQGVLVLEDQPEDADTLNSIFRAFHTFKGGSGFLHLVPVNRLSHELENLLDLARQGKLQITSPIINLILAGGDTLKGFLNELEAQLNFSNPIAPIPVPTKDLIRRVQAVIADPAGASQVVVAPSAPATANIAAPEVSAPAKAPTPAVPQTSSVNEATPKPASTAGHAIKVDTLKFDALVDLVGELVIAQSMVAQDPDLAGINSPRLMRNLSQFGRITKELQKIAMSLRMMPIRGTFQKMNRLVRDLTAKVNKKVELKTLGEDTEMDRTIVEELSDPLMHMIRNSVDHGIESTEARIAAGKSPQGTVTLSAGHQGGNIVIEIRDDGAGLRTDKILAKAVERGIVSPDAQLSDKEIFNLIFAPGFSTAEKVTDISGRGVGMDVVKGNITKLRGKIEIDSIVGQGTTFKIFLPLTLAIIDGLVVRVGEQRYILPTLSVRESFRPTREMISTVQQRGEMVNVRGHLSPMLRLHEYFGVKPRTTDPTEAIVVVVESAHEERCVMVDELVGKQEVVIKSLGEQFKNNKALAGAAILGDGRVGLILEPRTLVQLDSERKAA